MTCPQVKIPPTQNTNISNQDPTKSDLTWLSWLSFWPIRCVDFCIVQGEIHIVQGEVHIAQGEVHIVQGKPYRSEVKSNIDYMKVETSQVSHRRISLYKCYSYSVVN